MKHTYSIDFSCPCSWGGDVIPCLVSRWSSLFTVRTMDLQMHCLCFFVEQTLNMEVLSVCSLPSSILFSHIWNQVLNFYFFSLSNRSKKSSRRTNSASFTCWQWITHLLFLPEIYGVGISASISKLNSGCLLHMSVLQDVFCWVEQILSHPQIVALIFSMV